MFEVILMIKPSFVGESIPVARTDDAEAVRMTKMAIMSKAVREVALYELDPAFRGAAMAELRRLKEVLDLGEEGVAKC